jgi:hypothetical protein
MSHHVHTRRDDYVRLLDEFVSGACDGEDFKERFLHLRRRDPLVGPQYPLRDVCSRSTRLPLITRCVTICHDRVVPGP